MNELWMKEQRRWDDVLFPMNVHRFVCTPRFNIFTAHWHEELEFLMIEDGVAGIQVGSGFVELKAGEGVMICHDQIHAGHVCSEDGFTYTAVVLHPDLLYGRRVDAVQTKYLEPVLERRMPDFVALRPEVGWEGRVLDGVRRMAEAFRERPQAWEMLVKSVVLEVFRELVVNAECEPKPHQTGESARAERLKAVLALIRDRHAHRLPVQEAASAAGLSVGHFCAFFREMTGKTFVEYLTAYRLSRAAELLRATDRKILDVALSVGFENVSYFVNVFRRAMKETPHAYRLRMREPDGEGR